MAPSPGRQRDLFPLPFLEECPLDTRAGLCRTTARRVSRKNKSLEAANDAILAINQLGGRGDQCGGCIPADREYFSEPEGALRELLGASGLYEGAGAHVAPYAKDKVSWPEVGSSPLALVDGLPQADSDRLQKWASRMLRDPSEAEALRGARRPDCDAPTAIPIFSPSLPCTLTFADNMARNLVRLSKAGNRKADLGVFFVEKGDKIRLIMDTRIYLICDS